MEDKEKIVKVYSNNSKKSRLKRNKNKFQRIWDAEKQEYVKVRKTKYPAKTVKAKREWKKKNVESALQRRQSTPKKTKEKIAITTNNQVKQPARKPSVKVEKKAVCVNINGVRHTWDSKTLRYKRAA